MKTVLFCFIFSLGTLFVKAQSCTELMNSVKSNNHGTVYQSYDSDAISKVTFYDVTIDYQSYYFAIVCFKKEYSYNCTEYIYQVGSNTKFNYSINYFQSAGKAFWKYINPYNETLNCAPDFE